jgi:hypothetical protein
LTYWHTHWHDIRAALVRLHAADGTSVGTREFITAIRM